MNYSKIGKILGKIMVLESILMIAPLVVAIVYKEGLRNIFSEMIFVHQSFQSQVGLPDQVHDVELYILEINSMQVMS